MKQPIKPKYNRIDFQSLKAKKPRVSRRDYSNIDSCTYCLSKIVVSNGVWACTGNKLKMWQNEFETYSKLTEEQRTVYIENISNKQQFERLYESWLTGELACDFTERLYSALPSYTVDLPDPLFINKLEKAFGRLLTDEEKSGAVPIWKKGNKYFSEYEEGCDEIEIPTIAFPEDC